MFGRRVHVLGIRIHHGLVGVALVAFGLLLAALGPLLVGLLLAGIGLTFTVHDWHDRPWPLHDPELS